MKQERGTPGWSSSMCIWGVIRSRLLAVTGSARSAAICRQSMTTLRERSAMSDMERNLIMAGRTMACVPQVIDLRPVYHRKEERIRAHVILCWLALLLIRIAESAAGTTWNKIADELSLLTLGTFTGPDGPFRQTAELTQAKRGLLASPQIPSPRKIIEAAPAAAPAPGEAAASA